MTSIRKITKIDKGSGIYMKIQYQKEPSLKEDFVEVHYREESEKIKTIRDFFDAFQSITGRKENDIYKLHPESIYYLEVVDRKLFAYQEKEVYQLEYSFQHFLECFENSGFVRIGKSTAVNFYKVDQVKADLNMRLRLLMDNGEILILNRTYKKSFLEALHHVRTFPSGNFRIIAVLPFSKISAVSGHSGAVYIADRYCHADNMDRRMAS